MTSGLNGNNIVGDVTNDYMSDLMVLFGEMKPGQDNSIIALEVIQLMGSYMEGNISQANQIVDLISKFLTESGQLSSDFTFGSSFTYTSDGSGGWTASGGITASEAQQFLNYLSDLPTELQNALASGQIDLATYTSAMSQLTSFESETGINPNMSAAQAASYIDSLWFNAGTDPRNPNTPPTPQAQQALKDVQNDFTNLEGAFKGYNNKMTANLQFYNTQLNTFQGSENDLMKMLVKLISTCNDAVKNQS